MFICWNLKLKKSDLEIVYSEFSVFACICIFILCSCWKSNFPYMGLQLHILAPGCSSSTLPSQALSSQWVFLFLSIPLPFLWLLPAASVSWPPHSCWHTALFPGGSSSLEADLGILPFIQITFRWLCCIFGWKTTRIVLSKRFLKLWCKAWAR